MAVLIVRNEALVYWIVKKSLLRMNRNNNSSLRKEATM